MTHLTDDQLFQLAELSYSDELLNSEEEQQLEHIITCRECFNKYCVLATIMDATSFNSDIVFDPNTLKTEEITTAPVRKLLATLRITTNSIHNKILLIGEQIQQDLSVFSFEPVLSTAVRGGGISKDSVLRMEDIEDEDSYFIYDAKKHSILLRFAVMGTTPESIKAYLQFENQSTIDISLIQEGTYVKGIVSDIPSGNFEVHIEEK